MEDALILVGIPTLCKEHPDSPWDFFHLSTSSAFLNPDDATRVQSKLTKIQYGSNKMQFIDLIEPTSTSADGVVAFVHGGAWGSGQPWMYRLVALPFLKMNKAVAIVGYRTHPDADVNGQVADIGTSLNTLKSQRPDLLDDDGTIEALIGHSSGAHLGLLHVLESAKKSVQQQLDMTLIKKFYAVSGVYCISSHFEYEKGRGVDQVSALRVACGPHEKFEENSPAYRLECIQASGKEECGLVDGAADSVVVLDDHVPLLTFIHGIDDNIVQYTQCCDMVDAIHSALSTPDRCKEELLEGVGHADTVFHLMLGGVTRDLLEL